MSICNCNLLNFEAFNDVRFAILADSRSGVYADWMFAPRYNDTPIPFSNRSLVQFLGTPPATVQWRLEFECEHQYHALLGLQGTLGTLTVLNGFQSCAGVVVTKGNGAAARSYVQLDKVLLKTIGTPDRYVDGTIDVDVTFQRAIDPVTRLAVI